MESIAPQNAAATIAAECRTIPFPRETIITSATRSLAPEEMPSTKGPAIGFPKKVCNRYPDTESPPPRTAAASRRGRRMLLMMRAEVSPVSPRNRAEKASPGVMRLLPARRFSVRSSRSRTVRMPKQQRMRLSAVSWDTAAGSCVFILILIPVFFFKARNSFHPKGGIFYRFAPVGRLFSFLSFIGSGAARSADPGLPLPRSGSCGYPRSFLRWPSSAGTCSAPCTRPHRFAQL